MAKPIPYDDDNESEGEDERDTREVILYDDEVLQLMQGWTGGQSDPLYAISSMGGANEAWVFVDAIANIDSDLARVKKLGKDKFQLGKGTFTKAEIDELHQIRDALQMALDGTDGPHESREAAETSEQRTAEHELYGVEKRGTRWFVVNTETGSALPGWYKSKEQALKSASRYEHYRSITRRTLKRGSQPSTREPHHVSDFNTIDDLIEHARKEGATHVLQIDDETHLYFRRNDGKYEKAEVWQKDGYWHTQAPGSRTIVPQPPRNAKPITARVGRKTAEAPRGRTVAARREIEHELWLCQDCMIAEVNGDISGLDDERAEEVQNGIERLVEQVGPLSVNFQDGDGEKEFSRRSCDACGTRDAGARYRFASFGKQETRETLEASRKRPLFKVISQGHTIKQLGRESFSKSEAEDMAADLRNRGYDAQVVPDATSSREARENTVRAPIAANRRSAHPKSSSYDAWLKQVNDALFVSHRELLKDYPERSGAISTWWADGVGPIEAAEKLHAGPSRKFGRTNEISENTVRDYIAFDHNDHQVAGPFKSHGEAGQHVPPGGYVKFTSRHEARRRPPVPLFREGVQEGTWVPPVLASEGITQTMLEVLLHGMGDHAGGARVPLPGHSVVYDKAYSALSSGGYIVIKRATPGLSSFGDYYVLTDKGANVLNRYREEVRKTFTPKSSPKKTNSRRRRS